MLKINHWEEKNRLDFAGGMSGSDYQEDCTEPGTRGRHGMRSGLHMSRRHGTTGAVG